MTVRLRDSKPPMTVRPQGRLRRRTATGLRWWNESARRQPLKRFELLTNGDGAAKHEALR